MRSSVICACGSDCWEVDPLTETTAKCYNCGHERPFQRRRRGTGRTVSQQRVIDELLARVDARRHVTDLEVTDLDWGACSVRFRSAFRADLADSLCDDWFSILLSRRGSIKWLTRRSFGSPEVEAHGQNAVRLVY